MRSRRRTYAEKYRLLQIEALIRKFELANLRGPHSPEELNQWLEEQSRGPHWFKTSSPNGEDD